MDTLTPARRSEIMSRVRSKDTGPERTVRSALRRGGYRFRSSGSRLPGSPDVVLTEWSIALFVHGCFWHGCRRCDKGLRVPKTNRRFWLDKVAENRRRDRRVRSQLRAQGWDVVTIWQCDTRDLEALHRLLARRLPAR